MCDPVEILRIHYLEMRNRQMLRPKAALPGFAVSLVDPSDPDLNRRMYHRVGHAWDWADRRSWSDHDWHRYVQRSVLQTWIGHWHGQVAGYFELEGQEGDNVEIVYFGLLPEYIGRGLGGSLLTRAVECAWSFPDTRRVWLHTCTKDHPHALENYQSRGFDLYKTETHG